MGKAGRPKAEKPRIHILSVRLTDEEWNKLKTCASIKKTNMTVVARGAIVRSCDRLLWKIRNRGKQKIKTQP